ncbi:hypothetical protein BHF71_10930 [Vulcanibacillus modesticaldus]|uniref:Uncharacterized protein n=1 Tax=Vulcanibacillus modesticaldus TaxID=337097 RepID=A0A1D2YSR8_9BACI|nr:hypothetical protein [Vulcanibacillus modesticaldus]OEF97891.1 hypothetical protein BHF71_10930 [Vulcanibacillus modesticaldus]
MAKTDLEEIRSELCVIFNNIKDRRECYDKIIHVLKSKIPHYQTITIYLTDETAFIYYKHEGDSNNLKQKIPFGEGFLSIVAARGEISCEFETDGQKIYIPFYDGHHLLGEMIIKTTKFIDQDEVKLFQYIQELLSQVPN